MKKFISDSLGIYMRVTAENDTHYICDNVLFSKNEVITDYHPMDDLTGKLHLHVVPFYA